MSLTLDGTSGITSSGGTNVLQADSVITANLQNSAVTTAKIADLGVTEGKLANSAVTEGKIGSAAVTEAKIANSAVTSGKLASGAAAANLGSYVSSFNGSTGAVSYTAPVTSVNGMTGAVTVSASPTTAQVLTATAGASVGAVGTYAFFRNLPGNDINPGGTSAGSNFNYSNAEGTSDAGFAASGTWRCMGRIRNNNVQELTTLWLRIS